VTIFGEGIHNPVKLGMSGPVLSVGSSGHLIELSVKFSQSELAELRQAGVKLKDNFAVLSHEDGVMILVARNLAYNQNDTSIPVHLRFNIVKIAQVVEPAPFQPNSRDWRRKTRAEKDHGLFAKLPISKYLPKRESSGILPGKTGSNMLPNNARFIQVLDLTCESAQSVHRRLFTDGKYFHESEKNIVRHLMGASLVGAVADLHGNISPEGEAQPIFHGVPTLKNLRLGVDNTFRLQNFGDG
jgi:hypothetical protein